MSTPSASTNGTFYRLSDVPREEVTPQLSRRLISGGRFMLAEVDVPHIPSNVRHSGEAQEDTRVIDLFSPPREDWVQKTDAYLRR